jgi:hypothetical protein
MARRLHGTAGMKTKSNVKAGGVYVNHSQILRLRVRTNIKAGSGNGGW